MLDSERIKFDSCLDLSLHVKCLISLINHKIGCSTVVPIVALTSKDVTRGGTVKSSRIIREQPIDT